MTITDKAWRGWRKLHGQHLAAFSVTPEQAAGDVDQRSEFAKMFFAHDGRRAHKWTHYFEAYEEEFGRYRAGFPLPDGSTRPLRVLEIGVQHGGSLQLWRKFFGDDAQIWGLDVDPRCAAVDDPGLNVRIGSQDDPEFLRSVVDEMGGVDIVLDDGSHVAQHQQTSFVTLFPLVTEGGMYAVEDVHTAYWRDFGGGYRTAGSFIEVTKTLIDDVHAAYHRKGDKLGVGAASLIPRIAIYDSMVFVRKQPRPRPSVTSVGDLSF